MASSSLSCSKTSPNILANLRQLVPLKQPSAQEIYNLAALQAKYFREMSVSISADFPHKDINDQPRIFIAYKPNLPVDGSAHWNGITWIIVLNSSESGPRQRFSLAHEYKHILDHTAKHYLYFNTDPRKSWLLSESVADYFAACLLKA